MIGTILIKITSSPPLIIVWYKRDLRVSDHAPLTQAIKHARHRGAKLIALYSFEPSIISAPDFSAFHRQFIEESLRDLKKSLKKIGISLDVRNGEILDIFRDYHSRYHLEAVYSHEETGIRITYDRDIAVGAYFRESGISWHETPTNGVVRRLKSRDNWSKIWAERMESRVLPIPEKHLFGWDEPLEIEETPRKYPNLQLGGESIGQKVLEDFLSHRVASYISGMSRPNRARRASSRLSPYIAYGCLSLREVVQRSLVRRRELKVEGNTRALRSMDMYLARLHWQSHFIQKLESEPRFEEENAFIPYDAIRNTVDESIMDAIESGSTGIPFIDAIINCLKTTGWINFRARATLVSFVCNTCMQPWQGRFAHWLARHFTDYEPGIHYPQLQMQAETTGINTMRIYNPTKQAKDKDEDGAFISTWIPALAHLPTHLQSEPWKISEMESLEFNFVLPRDYPLPIVDVESANRNARKVLSDIKKSLSKDEKQAYIERHASRKSTRKRTKKPVETAQVSPQTSLTF